MATSKEFWCRYLLGALAIAIAAAFVAGCSGTQGQYTPAGSTGFAPQIKGHCGAHGSVRVTPCSVDLTASNPGPDTVVVRTDRGRKDTLTESDNCGGASGMATVTQGSGHSWIVTAGLTTGSCTATFTLANKHGKTLGWADLAITNSI